ncbi:hypothetical protein [Novosphingobium sp. PhB165]|uniref:hypothetical protein n=1 Tax=Novosphingobium sp. PhB165 TaxID=2485105 RepID=UPI00104AEAC2|nr:hypothetical protein [Novosphingobium sp. PhB165]
MNLASVLLYPLMLLLPAAGGGESGKGDSSVRGDEARQSDSAGYAAPDADGPGGWPADWSESAGKHPFAVFAFPHPEPESAWQIRIEQRMTIRISPRAPLPAEPLGDPDAPESRPRFTERKIGKCLPIAGIAGVQPDGQRNLLLYMRDRRIISVELERACRAGAFYSGFLLSRSADGQLCVDRDSLLSRSGSNCKLTRIRQLVAVEH